MQTSRRGAAVYALFVLSGAAGLVYEVVWSRLLKDVFGVTAHAVAAVLAAYLGGLALGSWRLGRYADRHPRPLQLYGLLEIGIGVAALIGTAPLPLLDPLHSWVAARLAADSPWLALVRLLLASVVVLPATVLMGATLPAIARVFVATMGRLGRELGFLYALNTAGAVAGCLGAGFVLIRALGVHGTLYLAVAVNLSVGAVALLLAAGTGRAQEETAASSPPEQAPGAGTAWVLPAIALSGIASLALEVIWTRVLVLILGSSTHAFVTMLSTFLVGIALGGFVARAFADRVASPRLAFGWVQAGIAASTLASIPLTGALVSSGQEWLLQMQSRWGALALARFGIAFLILIVPTTLIGMSFPLAAKVRVRLVRRIGSGLGEVYGANTLGNIAGALLGGFVLLPAAGMQRGIVLLAVLNLAAAAWAFWPSTRGASPGRFALRGAPVLAGAVLASVLLASWRPRPFVSIEEGEGDRVLYYREGLVSTVKVIQRADDARQRVMLVEGVRIGQSTSGIDYKQQVLAHFPFLLRPAGTVRDVLSIGLGTGIVAGEATKHPGVRRIDCVELSPSVIEGARFFEEYNAGILANPLAHIVADDGINFLKRSPARYDAIISDGKSRLGQAGNALFYSRDYYQSARDHLSPGGVMIQWMPLEEVPEDLRTIVRTFLAVFPDAYLWVGNGSLFLVGLDGPLVLDLPHVRRVLESPASAGLRRHGWRSATDVAATLVADGAAARPWVARERTLNSLEHPVLEFYSLRELAAPGAARVSRNAAALEGMRQGTLQRLQLPAADVPAVQAASRALGSLLAALSPAGAGEPGQAPQEGALLEKAARADPDSAVVRQWAGSALVDLGIGADQRSERALAVRLYRAAVDAWPEGVPARLNLAALLLEDGEVMQAVEQLQVALRLNPDSGVAHRLMGSIVRGANPQLAIAHFREALRIAPDRADVHQDLGRALAVAGRHDEALAEFQEAMRLQPGWAAPMAEAAFVLATRPDVRARNSTEAIRLARRASDLTGSSNAGVLQVLAASYAAAGRYEEAIAAQRKALAIASASGDTRLAAEAEGVLDLYQHRVPRF